MNTSIDLEQLLDGITKPEPGTVVIEPFAKTDILKQWLGPGYINISYDSNPQNPGVLRRDVLLNVPRYAGAYVLGMPPWLSKAKSEDKAIFERHGVDDLYKAFIKTLLRDPPMAGFMVVPLNFLIGIRESEKKRRQEFFRAFKPNRFNIFDIQKADEEHITLVVEFVRRTDTIPNEEAWSLNFYPSMKNQVWLMNPKNIVECPNENLLDGFTVPIKIISVRNHVEGAPIKANESLTRIIFENVDGPETRIGLRLMNKDEPNHLGNTAVKACDKSQIIIRGHVSKKLQVRIVQEFNTWLESWRSKTNSIFLPLFQGDNEPPRRRLKTSIALEIIVMLIWRFYNKN